MPDTDTPTDAELLGLTDDRRAIIIAALRESQQILVASGDKRAWSKASSRIRCRVFDLLMREHDIAPIRGSIFFATPPESGVLNVVASAASVSRHPL